MNVKNYCITLHGGITLGVILVLTNSLSLSTLKTPFAFLFGNVYPNTKPGRIAFTSQEFSHSSPVS